MWRTSSLSKKRKKWIVFLLQNDRLLRRLRVEFRSLHSYPGKRSEYHLHTKCHFVTTLSIYSSDMQCVLHILESHLLVSWHHYMIVSLSCFETLQSVLHAYKQYYAVGAKGDIWKSKCRVKLLRCTVLKRRLIDY
ncbi:hypothetical protein TNIN_217091 [Trichonephila inaurata madagascariensis]|uniref:Uncharacterized protein n=1 Tax=Trichonephila inaurata madagascariensis TaxID=2747483 RepID=A0A8X6YG08_9ARAC|nr:hypothetical protein TNIN_217091 [Trichonephila inaurata madagascariensis]